MTSKEIDKILKSPVTQGAKGRFISIGQLEQIKNKLKESEQKSNPTFLECIKEWNKKGFDVDIYALEIVIHNRCSVDKEEHSVEFTIDLKDKTLFMEGEYSSFPYDVVHLLSKTLKALEVKDDR